VPVPLTHSLLSELVAARRPSVTTALSGLQERGVLRREGSGWLLRGPTPTAYAQAPEDKGAALPSIR
jgi:CRP/FNR family cyclic AMP-dependent transcriptional regulator